MEPFEVSRLLKFQNDFHFRLKKINVYEIILIKRNFGDTQQQLLAY